MDSTNCSARPAMMQRVRLLIRSHVSWAWIILAVLLFRKRLNKSKKSYNNNKNLWPWREPLIGYHGPGYGELTISALADSKLLCCILLREQAMIHIRLAKADRPVSIHAWEYRQLKKALPMSHCSRL